METFLSKKVTQFADVVGNNIGKYLSLFYMAISAGRFAGPLIVGSLTRISTPNGESGWEGGRWYPLSAAMAGACMTAGRLVLGEGWTLGPRAEEGWLDDPGCELGSLQLAGPARVDSACREDMCSPRHLHRSMPPLLTRRPLPGDTFVCTTGWIYEPTGDVLCTGPADQQCGVTASDY